MYSGLETCEYNVIDVYVAFEFYPGGENITSAVVSREDRLKNVMLF